LSLLRQRLLGHVFNRRSFFQQLFLGKCLLGQFLEQSLILLVYFLDREQSIHQLVFAGIGVGEAEVHQLLGCSHQQEVGKSEFEVAGQEDELVGLGVEVQIIVVPKGEDAFQV